jgi:hypothetical protein
MPAVLSHRILPRTALDTVDVAVVETVVVSEELADVVADVVWVEVSDAVAVVEAELVAVTL